MGGTIVFIGDSITDCDRRVDPLGLGGGYVDIVASTLRARGSDVAVVNTGIAGDRVADLQRRFTADALDHAPSVLSLYVGVNDTVYAFVEGRATPLDEFERGYVSLVERALAAGVPRIIIVEPFFLDSDYQWAPWRNGNAFVHEDLAGKRAVVAKVAGEYGATFVPLQEAFDAAARERGGPTVAGDGVHPSAYGHGLIARLWLEAYDNPL